MTAPYPKQTCAAFGCKRWSRKFPSDWSFLCRDHWMNVPTKLRRLHSRRMRLAKKFDTPDLWAREARVWKRCIVAANYEQIGI